MTDTEWYDTQVENESIVNAYKWNTMVAYIRANGGGDSIDGGSPSSTFLGVTPFDCGGAS